MKLIEALHVFGSNPDYKNPKYIIPIKSAVKMLRWWQVDAFKKLKDESFGLVVAFCGSGKTILEVALSIHDIVASDWCQKQLIIVPQSHIGKGFIGDDERNFIMISLNGVIYDWNVEHNFCGDADDVIVSLRNWLLTDGKTLGRQFKGGKTVRGLNAVTTHQALGRVWNTLSPREKKIAIRNLTLRVDEAHHISGVYDVLTDEMEDETKAALEAERTNLGDVCGFIMNSKDKTAKLHLATATPMRGDRGIILSDKVRQKFEKYYLDWIAHFKTLGIEIFSLEYEEYVGDPIKNVVARIKKEPKEKHLIVIPSRGNKWRDDGDVMFQKLIKELRKIYPAERILDLVTDSTQAVNKQKLLSEPKTAERESMFDVVVTCMLGREGTDWCPCSRLHNTSCENSITLAVQTGGRPFRRFDGKTMVGIFHYARKFRKPEKGMTKRELFADRTHALLVCMQMDEMIHPIIIPPIEAVSGSHGGSGEHSHNSLLEVFGDQYQTFREDLVEQIECLDEKNAEQIDEVIDGLLDAYKVIENRDGVRDAVRSLVGRMLSPELRQLGINVDFVRKAGFDKIVEKYIPQGKSIFFGEYGTKDWEVLRAIMHGTWMEQFEAYKAAMEK